MPDSLRVLIVEDRPADIDLLVYSLQRSGFTLDYAVADTAASYLQQLERKPDVILSGYTLAQFGALQALALLQERELDIPFIIVTGAIGAEAAVECIKLGAVDCLLKDRLAHLGPVITNALRERFRRAEKRRADMQHSLLSQAMAQSIEGLAVLDLSGNILFANPAFERLYGFEPDGMLGRPFAEVYSSVRRSEAESITQEVLEKGFFRGEVWHIRPPGELFPVLLSQSLIRNASGLAIGMLVTSRDYTEQKRIEVALEVERTTLARRVEERTVELMVANAELGRASRMKDEFLANMSHELRTPLNAVLGLSEALLEETYGPLTAQQTSSLNRIQESGRHLLDLITDILDISKIEAGQIALEPAEINVREVCEASIRLVRQPAQKKNVHMVFDLEHAPEKMHADPRRLKQILVNLLTNGVKFTPQGREVGLEVRAEGEDVLFTVWDTGIGIHPFDLERIFEPFVQVDSSLSRQHPGTGLGLALVRRLTGLHGGTVKAESEPEKGSRFIIRLPAQQPALTRTPVEAPSAPPAVRVVSPPTGPVHGSLLMVEDHEANIITMSDYLSNKGFTVTVVATGQEMLKQLHKAVPDVILMDIQLPEANGLELMRVIRSRPEWQALPIIAVTALAMPGDRERCLEAGATEYLAKPVRLGELLVVILRLMAERGEGHAAAE